MSGLFPGFSPVKLTEDFLVHFVSSFAGQPLVMRRGFGFISFVPFSPRIAEQCSVTSGFLFFAPPVSKKEQSRHPTPFPLSGTIGRSYKNPESCPGSSLVMRFPGFVCSSRRVWQEFLAFFSRVACCRFLLPQ